MKVQAEISIYPLRTQSLSEPVEEYCRILRDYGLEVNYHRLKPVALPGSGFACPTASAISIHQS